MKTLKARHGDHASITASKHSDATPAATATLDLAIRVDTRIRQLAMELLCRGAVTTDEANHLVTSIDDILRSPDRDVSAYQVIPVGDSSDAAEASDIIGQPMVNGCPIAVDNARGRAAVMAWRGQR